MKLKEADIYKAVAGSVGSEVAEAKEKFEKKISSTDLEGKDLKKAIKIFNDNYYEDAEDDKALTEQIAGKIVIALKHLTESEELDELEDTEDFMDGEETIIGMVANEKFDEIIKALEPVIAKKIESKISAIGAEAIESLNDGEEIVYTDDLSDIDGNGINDEDDIIIPDSDEINLTDDEVFAELDDDDLEEIESENEAENVDTEEEEEVEDEGELKKEEEEEEEED